MKRSNFTFLFLFALLSFASNSVSAQASCIGDVNASVSGADCTVDLSGLVISSSSPATNVKFAGFTVPASMSGSVTMTNVSGLNFATLIGTTKQVSVDFEDGTTCWGNVTFEAKDIPGAGGGEIIDTICCGEELPWNPYEFKPATGTCYADLVPGSITTTEKRLKPDGSALGTICDSIMHIQTIQGSFTGADNAAGAKITLRIDTVFEFPLQMSEIQYPIDPYEVSACAVGDADSDDYPDPAWIAAQGGYKYDDNGNIINIIQVDTMRLDTAKSLTATLITGTAFKSDTTYKYAFPYIVKTNKVRDSIRTYTRKDTLDPVMTKVEVSPGVWAVVPVVTKRDVTVVDTLKITEEVIIPLKNTETGNNVTTCNINVKCQDMVLDGGACGETIMRMWTVIDWCNPNKSVREEVQWIKISDTTAPIITGDKTQAVALDPWNCSFNPESSYTVTDNCTDTDDIIINEDLVVTGNTATLTITATDGCGNTSAPYVITMTGSDNSAPVAVITDELTVAIGGTKDDGRAKVWNTAVDAGSYDNCGEVSVKVRRADGVDCATGDDAVWADFAEVCCIDIPPGEEFGYVKIDVIVVADGDTTESWTNVRVEDKSGAVVRGGTWPAECAAPFNSELIGFVENMSQGSICKPVGNITVGRINGPDACGQGEESVDIYLDGVLVRGESVVVKYSGNAGEFTASDIDWSEIADTTLTCSEVNEDRNYGQPIFTSPVCNLVAWSVDNSDFIWDGELCGKVIRDFTVIDWCKFDQARENKGVTVATAEEVDGVFKRTQIIKFIDGTAPIIAMDGEPTGDVTGGKTYKEDPSECVGDLTFKVTASDSCGSFGNLEVDVSYEYTDLDGELVTGLGTEVTLDGLSTGVEYSVKFTAADKCGNAASIVVPGMINDTKAPTPVCRPGINTTTMNNGSTCVEIWAKDYDLGSFDNCSVINRDTDIFFYDEDGFATPTMQVCCSDLIGNMASLDLYVRDENGNEDFCTVHLRVQDNFGACIGEDKGAAAIAGEVRTELGDMIESAEVSLNAINTDMTSVDGKYAFGNNPMYASYEVTSKKNDDYLNGVTTLDLVLIQKHVLGIEALDSPYKVIAADINGDQGVSAIDLVELRKLILGVYNELPSNDSWRFVDATETFADANDPFPFTEALRIGDLNSPALNQDFLGVKIGDVSGNAIANSLIAAGTRSAGTLSLEIADAAVAAGEEVSVAVTAANFSDIAAYQFTMNVNGLELSGVESGAINVSAENFGLIDNNTITTAWNSTAGVSTTDVLFTMNFTATAATTLSNAISISSSVTSAAAYTANADQLDVQVSFNGVAANEFALFQNQPNPFDNVTNIAFELPTAASATLTVFDVTGKTVSIVKGDFAKGSNTITLDKSDLNTSGVLYYQLESGSFTATKKMIVLE